jgi:superfamily I DNA/RNA helicase
MKWSEEQEAIFDWFVKSRGNLIVRARAGTGKTTTILEAALRAPEKAILLAAFNKNIADELKARIPVRHIEAKTLHGLGYKFVMQNVKDVRVDTRGERKKKLAEQACVQAKINIADKRGRDLVALVADLHNKAREIAPWLATHSDEDAAVKSLTALAIRFDMVLDDDDGGAAKVAATLARQAMKLAMAPSAVIDFADMIFLPIVNGWIRPWYDLVIVDEAQDMTPAQLFLARGACRKNGRVAVVGDDRQAIYGFRGADSGALDRLKTELEAHEVGLTITYRCPKSVVELAAEIVPDYRAADDAPEGEVVDMAYVTMIEEAREGDFILSRKNAPLVRVCLALLKRGMRASIRGRDIGQGIISLVRRLKARTIDDLTPRLKEWKDKEYARAMERLSKEAAAERIAHVWDQADIVEILADDAHSLAELERACTQLFSDDPNHPPVVCSSVHKAKGLEASNVYMMVDTFSDESLEEDNIRYVAITRAKARLVLVEGGVKKRRRED